MLGPQGTLFGISCALGLAILGILRAVLSGMLSWRLVRFFSATLWQAAKAGKIRRNLLSSNLSEIPRCAVTLRWFQICHMHRALCTFLVGYMYIVHYILLEQPQFCHACFSTAGACVLLCNLSALSCLS